MGFSLAVVYALIGASSLAPLIGVQEVLAVKNNQKLDPYNEVLETSI
jgi:hypothetical protein